MRLWKSVITFPKEMHKLPRSVRQISLVFFIYYFSWGLVTPFLPIYFKEVLGNYSLATTTIAFLYLFAIVWSIPMGDIVDKFSKRALVRFFLVLYLPVGFVLAYLSSFIGFIFYRIYHSFIGTGLWSASESYVRVHSPERRRAEAMGLFDLAYTLSLIVGTAIGGFVVFYFHIRFLFFLMPVFIFLAMLFAAQMPDHYGSHKVLKTFKKVIADKPFFHEFKYFWSIPGLVAVTFLSFLFNVAVIGQSVLLPFFSEKLGANAIELGLLYALFSVPILFEAPFSVVADNYNNRKMLIFGAFLSIILLSALFFVTHLVMLFFLAFLLGMAFVVVVPVIEGNVTRIMAHHKTGELNGVYRSFVSLAMGLGVFVVGPISDIWGVRYSFLVGIFAMVVFLGSAFLFWPKIEKVIND